LGRRRRTRLGLFTREGRGRGGISENIYLNGAASTVCHEVTITVNDDGSWSYAENTTLALREFAEPFPHTDHNTLHRVV